MKQLEKHLKIITNTIEDLDINLKDLTIATEVASSYYIYTPIIAILANASKVYAVVNDSKYGTAKDIIQDCRMLMKKIGVDESKVVFKPNCKDYTFLKEADIITNSGNLRPLDEHKLKGTKAKLSIPIMYEKWELRAFDIDINYCKVNNIKVGGTWENHPKLKVFNYCKHLMLKLIFDAGFEVYKNNIIVYSSDEYGHLLEAACKDLGAANVIITNNELEVMKHLHQADFIFFCDYNNLNNLITTHDDSIFDLNTIKKINPVIEFVHLVGNIDNEYIKSKGFSIFPDKHGYAQKMTETLAYLGPNPVLKLLTAGFKVGEELNNNTVSELTQI